MTKTNDRQTISTEKTTNFDRKPKERKEPKEKEDRLEAKQKNFQSYIQCFRYISTIRRGQTDSLIIWQMTLKIKQRRLNYCDVDKRKKQLLIHFKV